MANRGGPFDNQQASHCIYREQEQEQEQEQEKQPGVEVERAQASWRAGKLKGGR
ncbi:hypothetical protein Dda_3929 [Drechslerella dactyloides]|uniref:Uncharacterized protein n=1 Tax=Drechslerella dactyloides TaxID=74499 RepID=A0AAD6IZ97_DREDA|nr:hypothetical protein Dda_3929 [Drechslerella dactyloides]